MAADRDHRKLSPVETILSPVSGTLDGGIRTGPPGSRADPGDPSLLVGLWTAGPEIDRGLPDALKVVLGLRIGV